MVEYIITHLDELGPLGLPEIDPNVDDVFDMVNTHSMIYLPARYVSLFLDSGGYTVRQVWDKLYPALVEANELQICLPLLKWMRVASMRTVAVDGTPRHPPLLFLFQYLWLMQY